MFLKPSNIILNKILYLEKFQIEVKIEIQGFINRYKKLKKSIKRKF